MAQDLTMAVAIVSTVIGVVVGLLSVGFIHAIDLAQQLWLGVSGEFLASGLKKQPFWRRLIGRWLAD